jgi:hypothetical protein
MPTPNASAPSAPTDPATEVAQTYACLHRISIPFDVTRNIAR